MPSGSLGRQYSAERTGVTRIDPVTGQPRPLRSDDPYYLSPGYLAERWAIGSVETCAKRIAGWLQAMRLERLVFQPSMPGRPLDEAIEATRRVVGEVWPRGRQIVRDRPPAET